MVAAKKVAKKAVKRARKKAPGRPPYVVNDADRTFVERAVMAGSTILDIAAALNLHQDTLRKHYRYEIVTSRERLKVEALRVMMDSLADGSLDAAKFVLARRAGWSEKSEVDHSSTDGTMTPTIITRVIVDPRNEEGS